MPRRYILRAIGAILGVYPVRVQNSVTSRTVSHKCSRIYYWVNQLWGQAVRPSDRKVRLHADSHSCIKQWSRRPENLEKKQPKSKISEASGKDRCLLGNEYQHPDWGYVPVDGKGNGNGLVLAQEVICSGPQEALLVGVGTEGRDGNQKGTCIDRKGIFYSSNLEEFGSY